MASCCKKWWNTCGRITRILRSSRVSTHDCVWTRVDSARPKKGGAGGAALKNGRLWTAQRPKMGLTCPRLSTRTFVWTRAKALRRIDFYREMSTVHSYISFLHTDGQEDRYPCCIREWLKCVDSGHATSCLRRSAAAPIPRAGPPPL
jgi:hypothetical protein